MYKFFSYIIQLLCYMPFGRFLIKSLYRYSLRSFRDYLKEVDNIKDIYLLSKMDDKNFIYGISDMNFVLVIENHAYPKAILKEIRKEMLSRWPINMFINTNRLPVLYEKEFENSLTRSFLIGDIENSAHSWLSLFQNKRIEFKVSKQGRYANKYFYMRQLEKYFMNSRIFLLDRNWLRSYGKYILLNVRSLAGDGILKLSDYKGWIKISEKIQALSPLSQVYYPKHYIQTWRILDQGQIPYNRSIGDSSQYPKELLDFCEKLMVQDGVEDILLTPALLQIHEEQIQGKVFIDVILSERLDKFSFKGIRQIKKIIEDFDDDEELQEAIKVKTDFRLTTLTLFNLQSQKSLFPYPLEVFYRQRRTFSVRGRKYQIKVSKKMIERSIIHFTLLQFMRFRSQHLKSTLIGSRFIKSLNLMNRYVLILEYLDKKDFEVPKNYKEMLDKVTPQLSHIRPNEKVTYEEWRLIQAQLLYSLKKIRDHLGDDYPSIKNLTF